MPGQNLARTARRPRRRARSGRRRFTLPMTRRPNTALGAAHPTGAQPGRGVKDVITDGLQNGEPDDRATGPRLIKKRVNPVPWPVRIIIPTTN